MSRQEYTCFTVTSTLEVKKLKWENCAEHTFYPSLDISSYNIVIISLILSHYPLSLWRDDI